MAKKLTREKGTQKIIDIFFNKGATISIREYEKVGDIISCLECLDCKDIIHDVFCRCAKCKADILKEQ